MRATDHNKILVLGFAGFAAIFAFTFVLLMLISLGVFVALGITAANETGDTTQAGIAILGGAFAVVFYCALAAFFALPTAIASWKLLKRGRGVRLWGIIAALLVLPIMPMGTLLSVYALWFFYSGQGRQFYTSVTAQAGVPTG
jgi:hypothetical protein